MPELLLRVVDVRKAFGGVSAVDGVSFDLARGELRALIGPNGAGKSTFFNLLTGQLPADGGAVAYRGEDILGLAPHVIWRRVGTYDIFDEPWDPRERASSTGNRSPT